MADVTLMKLIEQANTLRHKIAKIEAQKSDLSKELTAMKFKILQRLVKLEGQSLAGRKARATVRHSTAYKITDYVKLKTYILRNKALDLLPRRVNTEAVRERIQAGKPVPPGLEETAVITVVLTDVKTKE